MEHISNVSSAAAPATTTTIAHTRGCLKRSQHRSDPLRSQWDPPAAHNSATSDAVQREYVDTTGWAD
jgi:hypothetical protein